VLMCLIIVHESNKTAFVSSSSSSSSSCQHLNVSFPPPGFEPRSGHVGFVVDKVALGQVFSEYLGFPSQFSFQRLLHTHHLSSGAGTICQLVAEVPSGYSLTPPQETKTLGCSGLLYDSISSSVSPHLFCRILC
jgi:hypothetical protein